MAARASLGGALLAIAGPIRWLKRRRAGLGAPPPFKGKRAGWVVYASLAIFGIFFPLLGFLSFLRSSNSYFRAWGRRANDSGWLREVPTPPSGLTTAMRTTTLDCRGLCVKGARLGAEPAGIQSARRSSIGPTTIVRWIDSAKPQRRDPKACFARLKLTQDRVGIKRDKQELPPMARP